MTTYHCDGFKPIKLGAEIGWRTIETANDAAWVFGERLAKRRHGKRGECAICRLDSYRQDNNGFSFEVFIGVGRDGGTSGRNEWLYITAR
jgi:hypothetical protein